MRNFLCPCSFLSSKRPAGNQSVPREILVISAFLPSTATNKRALLMSQHKRDRPTHSIHKIDLRYILIAADESSTMTCEIIIEQTNKVDLSWHCPSDASATEWSDSSCGDELSTTSVSEPQHLLSQSSEDKPRNKAQKSVSFGQLCVRYHPMIPGDHPECTEGVPLTIDWDHVDEFHIPVEEYESIREPRKPNKGFRLTGARRRRMMGEAGFNILQIRAAWEECNRVKQERSATLHFMKNEKFALMAENVGRKMRKVSKIFSAKRTAAVKA